MLRRYSTIGLQNHILTSPTTLIGSSSLCDIVVKGPGVAERHALIEYHPVIRSYWLRDLGTLGGTYCNDKILYGMVELKSADVLRFGKSAEFVFDFPAIQPSPERSRRASIRIGHSQCTENGFADKEQVALPVIGNKVTPKPGSERFSRPSMTSAKICQQPMSANGTDSDSPATSLSISTAPIIMNESSTTNKSNTRIVSANTTKRSSSLGREITATRNSSRRLPMLKTTNDVSGRNYLPQINGDKKKLKETGNQLLQRIVRLQQELHRKDEEIIKLKENAVLPSTTGDRVQKHLNDYRIALAESEAENAKLRAILARDPGQIPDKAFEDLSERMKKVEVNQKLSDLVYRTFFAVVVDELEGINKMCVKFKDLKKKKQINESTARDYADVIGEIIKVIQDPFSFRLMEISTKCNHCFEKEKLTKQQKQQVAEMFDNFLKQVIFPLSRALDTFLPVIKDTSFMARESAKACNVFSQWSRELGDQVRKERIASNVLLYKIEDLQSRFKENGLTKHWLPPSVIPLLKAIVLDKTKKNNQEHHNITVSTDTSRSDPNSQLPSLGLVSFAKKDIEKRESEFKKLKSNVKELQEVIDRLRTEKEELVRKISSMEDSKYSLENSTIRTRRTVGNGNLTTEEPIKRPITPAPSIEVEMAKENEEETEIKNKIIMPKINLQDSLDSEKDSPEELNDLIEAHNQTANPPSEVDVESVEKNSQLDELEEFEKIESAIDKGIDADDEISEKSIAKNSHPGSLYEDSVVDVDENETWITGALDQEILKAESLTPDEEKIHLEDEDLKEYERAKKEAEHELNHHEREEFTAESSEDNLNKINRNESIEESEIPTPETPRPIEEDNLKKEREMIEFWHLATALANMLGVRIPEDDDPETEADNEEEREQKKRKLVLDGIVKAMGDLLKHNREE